MNISDTVSDYVADFDLADLSAETVEHLKTCVLDWLGVCLVGSSEPAAQYAGRVAAAAGGKPEATVLGQGFATSALLASLVNGVSGHALDFDDVYYQWTPGHPSCTVLPAVLSLAEAKDCSGSQFLAAAAAGLQVQYAVGEAIMPQHYDQGWHNTGTLGHLGAATACAHLLQLDRLGTKNALGTAAAQAAGLRGMFGSMCKPLHAGKAAMDGLLAALLAAEGFTSSADPLAGYDGFLQVYATSFDQAKLERALISSGSIVDRIRFKPYPTAFSTHGMIEVMARVKRVHGIALEDVRDAKCIVHPRVLEIAAIRRPTTELEAKFSARFLGALALRHGTVTLADLSPHNLADPALQSFAGKLELVSEPAYSPSRSATAVLTLRDGRVIQETVSVMELQEDKNAGRLQAREKFLQNLALVPSGPDALELLGYIDQIDTLASLKALTVLL